MPRNPHSNQPLPNTMKTRKVALVRGVSAGLAAGVLWWATEWAANWAMGGTPSAWALVVILGLDLAFGVVGGALLGLLTGATSIPVLALGLTAVFGFLRIFEPPGVRSELLYFALAPVCVAFGVRLAGRERRGSIAFVQLTLVGVAAIVFGKALITDEISYFSPTEPNALVLVGLLLVLPLAGMPSTGSSGSSSGATRRASRSSSRRRSRGRRPGEAALHRGPRRPAVARPRRARGARRVPDLDGHDARRPHVDVRLRARDVAEPDRARRRRAQLHAGALAGAMDRARARLDADRHVPEPARRALRRRLESRARRSTAAGASSRSPTTRRRSPRCCTIAAGRPAGSSPTSRTSTAASAWRRASSTTRMQPGLAAPAGAARGALHAAVLPGVHEEAVPERAARSTTPRSRGWTRCPRAVRRSSS